MYNNPFKGYSALFEREYNSSIKDPIAPAFLINENLTTHTHNLYNCQKLKTHSKSCVGSL